MILKNCIFYKLTEISIYDEEYYDKIPDGKTLAPSSELCSNDGEANV